jgi:multiple sugar transport system ATP-binding protein
LPVPVTATEKAQHSGSITVGIRPESFKISDATEGIPVKVTVVEELGADAYLFGVTDDALGEDAITAGTNIVVRVEARRKFEKGSMVHVTAEPTAMHVFDTETGERIGVTENLQAAR